MVLPHLHNVDNRGMGEGLLYAISVSQRGWGEWPTSVAQIEAEAEKETQKSLLKSAL